MSKGIFAFVFLLLVAIATANVVNLTPDNIDQVIANDADGILVKFYAPWCGHCKSLAPEYEAAAGDLVGTGVVLAEADCDAHRLIGERYQITGYPTLKWFRNGKVYDYGGGRTRKEIVSWVKRNTVNSLEVVSSQTELEARKPSGSVYALAVLFGDNAKIASELLDAARVSDDLQFAQVKSDDLITSEGAEKGTVRLYKQDGSVVNYAADTENILELINNDAYPKYVEFNQAAFTRLSKSKSLIIFGFAPFENKEKLDQLFSLLSAGADAHSDVGFVYGDSTAFARGLSGAGASLNFLPTIVAIQPGVSQLVWDEEIELTSTSLSTWIGQVFAGNAPTNKKSEPLPASNDGPVVKLVYKNYNEYFSLGKPIFVKYYAPWCGHCKNMAGDWIKLGESVDKNKVIIADYDATANYAEVESIEGFPTLVFYDGKGGKEVYNGDRTFDSLLKFVNAQVSDHSHSHDEL